MKNSLVGNSMKITSPNIFFAQKQEEYPLVFGEWKNHNLPNDVIIGTPVKFSLFNATFDIAYLPHNHKRDRLLPILIPDRPIPEQFWAGDYVQVKQEPKVEKKVNIHDVF